MGAQGPVFRAQDTVAGQIVAIKAFKLDVSPELAKPELRKETVRRLREWLKKTGFTFNKDTPRVPYHKPAVAPR